jgi:putative transcriptional regulator
MNADWFSGRLRELREASGLTQQELAGRAGLTREGVAQLETGRREPAWRTVVALCQALGVECGEFIKEPAPFPEHRRGRPPKASPVTMKPKKRGSQPRKEK